MPEKSWPIETKSASIGGREVSDLEIRINSLGAYTNELEQTAQKLNNIIDRLVGSRPQDVRETDNKTDAPFHIPRMDGHLQRLANHIEDLRINLDRLNSII